MRAHSVYTTQQLAVDLTYLGDATESLRRVPDNSVDLVFADPPFNLKKKYTDTKDFLPPDSYLRWSEKWLAECARVVKVSGSVIVHNIPKWLLPYGQILGKTLHFKHWIAWEAATSPMGKSLQPSHYGLLYFVKDLRKTKFYEIRSPHKTCRKCHSLQKDYGGKIKQIHPFGPLCSDVWTDLSRLRHKKYRDAHPCQLPVPLLERIILMTTDHGDMVLDPFMGAGTTGVASVRLNRRFIGFDNSPEYVSLSNRRSQNESPCSSLGQCWVGFHLNKIVTLRDCDWDKLSPLLKKPLLF